MASSTLHAASATDGLRSLPNGGPLSQKNLVYEATLTGALTVDHTYPNMLKLDPGGAHRDVTLDAVGVSPGLLRWVVNAADAAENLVLKNAGGSTIATVNQNEEAIVFCDGDEWILFRVATIALS
jgi:hypothetical protein